MKRVILIAFILMSCASTNEILGTRKLNTPPEFKQRIILEVDDNYQPFQTPRSGYDIGDLQSFHSQHTLPIVIEEAFKEMFTVVELAKEKVRIEKEAPDVPAVFEVRILDLANDITFEFAETYRAQITLAVAMKSPRGTVFWQKAFRGEGFAQVDSQFSTGLGPEQAVQDALSHAIRQMQDAIIKSGEVRAQLKYYLEVDAARRKKEVTLS